MAIAWNFILVPYRPCLTKATDLEVGYRRFHRRIPDIQICCSVFINWWATRSIIPAVQSGSVGWLLMPWLSALRRQVISSQDIDPCLILCGSVFSVLLKYVNWITRVKCYYHFMKPMMYSVVPEISSDSDSLSLFRYIGDIIIRRP